MSPEMALRLSSLLGPSPESWLAMQDQYDCRHAREYLNLRGLRTHNVLRN